jgi:hypothetical protein
MRWAMTWAMRSAVTSAMTRGGTAAAGVARIPPGLLTPGAPCSKVCPLAAHNRAGPESC